jgi:hypothetical protein
MKPIANGEDFATARIDPDSEASQAAVPEIGALLAGE